jgi:hypothetical protein
VALDHDRGTGLRGNPVERRRAATQVIIALQDPVIGCGVAGKP